MVVQSQTSYVAVNYSVLRTNLKNPNFCRLKNELQALQRANHENILRVFGWTQWEGSVGLVTELMTGRSLRLLLSDQSIPLQPLLRLRISKEIAESVAFIHNFSSTKRLTHGDLKPENVLLTSDLHCKIGDFGSVRLVSYTGVTTATSETGAKRQLTPVYAAPERLRHISCRPRAEQDVYSYGLIVHGVLSRETPSQYSVNETEYLEGIKRGERPSYEPIDDLLATLTDEGDREIVEKLKDVMTSCWQHEPSARPKMLEVRDELQQQTAKYKPSDVSRAVALAQDKSSIFAPTHQGSSFASLSSFNPQSGCFLQKSELCLIAL